jgi:acyl-CoA thioester hydrolase
MRKAPEDTVDVDLEVPFHDVDPLKVVWHGHYYKYVEIGRTALLRARGVDFGLPSIEGSTAYVIETKCRHTYPLHYGDKFRVRTWIADCEHMVTIGFEILNLTQGKRSAWGHTLLASVNAAGELLLEIPEPIRRLLR